MATLSAYDTGDLVRVTGTLTEEDGTPVDPTALTCKVKAPSGTVTTHVYGVDPFPVRTGPGVYYVDVTPAEVGEYRYRFASTGTGQAADEGAFVVKASTI